MWNDFLNLYREHRILGTAMILAGTLLAMAVMRLLVIPLIRRASRRTRSEIDDRVIDLMSPALLQSLFLIGLGWAVIRTLPADSFDGPIVSVLATLLILIWGRCFTNAGSLIFSRLSASAGSYRWIQPQSLALFQFAFKVMLVGLIAYLLMSAWHVNLTSWLASAGVLGIAIGFAAKDTLANFISGIFILVDAPYKVGDIIIIDETTRGLVQDIGMRSTRLLTTDNIEVTVPNAVIGSSKIVNESSGPSLTMRLRAHVSVAYGSDVDQVREVLVDCARDLEFVSGSLEPVVRFEALGDSGLDFTVRVMIDHPRHRAAVRDELNTRIYKALNEARIEIPFPQQDLHIRDWPGSPGTQQADAE